MLFVAREIYSDNRSFKEIILINIEIRGRQRTIMLWNNLFLLLWLDYEEQISFTHEIMEELVLGVIFKIHT